MPRPKEHETTGKQVAAWQAENTDRLAVNIRKDGRINKEVIQKAAKAAGKPVATYVMEAIRFYIGHDRGPVWLAENENRGGADDGDKKE